MNDLVFAIGVIEYLANPRRCIHAAAAVLNPGGRLVITAPNPVSLRSLIILARHGEFSAFKESSNPGSITPVLVVDAARMFREAGLDRVAVQYANHGGLPGGRGLTWQRLVPTTGGRWFSDDFRVAGTCAAKKCK